MCARSKNNGIEPRERESESSKNQISISKTRYNTQIVKSSHDQWERREEEEEDERN